MMEQLQSAVASLAHVDKLRTTVGQALTPNQQMAISTRIKDNPDAFIKFVQTDEGRVAVRVLADAFIASNRE